MKKGLFNKILIFLSSLDNKPKYTNFYGLEDYNKVVNFAKKHPDVKITEKIKNDILIDDV